jgi:O-antigen biosynthesis protein
VSPARAGHTVDHLRRGVRLWQTAGAKGTAQRVARSAYRRLDGAALEFPLLLGDVADSRRLRLPAPEDRPDRGRRLNIGWVSSPPGLGSGGHTTMFRMVEALEAAGHTCTMFLYDRYSDDARRHEATIRQGWPSVRARVVDAREGIGGVDACVATSWHTAHVLAARGNAPMSRLYLVQDFEPFFYPRGAEYALAEDTYRFGFRCIAVGNMVADLLRKEVGVSADVVEFGCDTEIYRLQAQQSRDGVVFYCKPGAARRGFILGLLALEELHRRRPDVPIHLVGDPDAQVPFPASRHGVLSPQALSDLYNRTRAGLALSFTNISLIAEELLACGTVPVVNDSPYARADVKSKYVRWAPPTPSGLADELLSVSDSPPDAARVAASARDEMWRPAQATFLASLEDEVYADL